MTARRLFRLKRFHLAPVVLCAAALAAVYATTWGQETAPAGDVCDEVRHLMSQNITPYDLNLQGGELRPGVEQTGIMSAGDYASLWSFTVQRVANEVGILVDAPFDLAFSRVADGLRLEMQLFRGMDAVADASGVTGYQLVAAGASYSYALSDDRAIYTLVIRRSALGVGNIEGSYAFTPTFTSGAPVAVNNLRDESAASLLRTPPQFVNGHERILMPDRSPDAVNMEILIHPGAPYSVASYGGARAQVLYGLPGNGYGLSVNAWAERVVLLGGDLAVTGIMPDGTPRLFYLENFGYQVRPQDNDLLTFTDAGGARVQINWDILQGVWITDACAGFRLQDGRTFTGWLDPVNRTLTARGTLDEFTIALAAPGQSLPHRVSLSWAPVASPSELRYYAGVFSASLQGERSIELESAAIDLRPQPSGDPAAPLAVTLADRDAALLLDWVNLRSFVLRGSVMRFSFIDQPRTTASRSAVNLLRVEALNDVIRIIYRGEGDGGMGEERLLLPASEAYVELITPAGLPAYNGRALAGEADYAPRALNNTGGECYPVNTLLPEANCPPNGHPNPANGNLWYAVTDHVAYGGLIDLALTRSYNSALAEVQGAFGYGWTSSFALDYDVAYDPVENTRPIDRDAAARYPVGLNLTWAPRGLVTFTTPGGSQHVFVTQDNSFDGGDLTAITMPGWTLSRPGVRGIWTLRQNNGLTYEFDRAGRLLRYGYFQEGRIITVEYPAVLGGPGSLGEAVPVIITDLAQMRRLELYYDAEHRIVRSILRDVRTGAETAACHLADNCFEITYTYDDGLLTTVAYPGGQRAAYLYDSATRRLVAHDDPRAPIAPAMTYTYGSDGGLRSAAIERDGAAPLVWRRLSDPRIERDFNGAAVSRTVTVTDEHGSSRAYTYVLEDGLLKSPGTNFTLTAQTSPLAVGDDEDGGYEARPIIYTWINGLLESQPFRQVGVDNGRTNLNYDYTPAGDVTAIDGGYPEFGAAYLQLPGLDGLYLPQTVTFPDASQMTFTYDRATGWLDTATDRYGGVYRYIWDGAHRLVTLESLSDGTAVDYAYNAVGLVNAVTRRLIDGDPQAGHTVAYAYDGLGRLVSVDDPLTGAYTIVYPPPDTEGVEIHMRDATGALTTAVFDTAGRLAEIRVASPGSQGYLRRETYSYDDLGRITAHTRWLAPFSDEDGAAPPDTGAEVPITTRYRYDDRVTTLPGIGEGQDRQPAARIDGYAISVIDPYRERTRTFTYDALGRIRQIADEFQRITRYEYVVDDAEIPAYGLRINQYDFLNNRLLETSTYVFDERWQLISAAQGGETWQIVYAFASGSRPTSRPRLLDTPDFLSIVDLFWGEYRQGRPASVTVSAQQAGQIVRRRLDAAYDFRGRPLEMTDGSGTTYGLLYCPQADGGERIVYTRPVRQSATAFVNCDGGSFAQAITYDAAGRLARVEDEFGARDYVYTAGAGQWRVDVTFTGAGSASSGAFQWMLVYDAAGDLILWTDENGITRRYRYDTLGRLRRVAAVLRGVVDGVEQEIPQPEASFTFLYNEADLLTSVLDDLGRGTRYAYDDLGQLTVEQDARTGNVTIYGYNAAGKLATVISPLGNTTTYLYDDPGDPTRLSGIIDPTGAITRFEWDEEGRTLIYTGPRGGQTRYIYDSFGALVQIIPPLGAPHDLVYDAAGHLVGWRQAVDEDGVPAREFTLERAPYSLTLSETSAGESWRATLTITPSGRLAEIAAPQGEPLAFSYDGLGRLSLISTGDRAWTLAHLGGQPALVYDDGVSGARTLTFDALHRLVSEQSEGAEAALAYTRGRGADVDVLLENNRVITYSPGDTSLRPRAVILRAPGQRISYIYNDDGLLTEIITETCIDLTTLVAFDPAQPDDCVRANPDQVWRTSERFAYDGQGRPIRYIDQEDNIATFAYDDAGNLTNYQNVKGQSFNYIYDALHRLTSIAGPTGIRLLLAYDALDNVTGICLTRADSSPVYEECVQAGGLLESYTYDALGRLTGQQFANNGGQSLIQYVYGSENAGLLSAWGLDPQQGVVIQRDRLGSLESVTYTDFAAQEEITISGSLNYDFDGQGRLAAVTVGSHRLLYEYLADGRGYILRDEASGSGLEFRLDERGFLSGIAFDPGGDPGANPGQTAPRVRFDYFLSPGGRVLVVQVRWNNNGDTQEGELIEFQLNRQGVAQNITYLQSNLFIDYVSDAAGQVQRQSISGAERFFEAGSNGYITLIGYDNDDRPLTMRVTDRSTGDVIYLLSFTYNALGQRVTETRQYAVRVDGQAGLTDTSQATITYEYNNLNQLIRRSFSEAHSRPLSQSALPALAALLAVGFATGPWKRHLWGRRLPAWARILGLAFASGVLLVASSSVGDAQQRSETYSFVYQYDAAGNLVETALETPINLICTQYFYDSANRLVEVRGGDGLTRQTYSYDVLNRVIRAGDRHFAYLGDTSTLAAIYTHAAGSNAGSTDETQTPLFYGQTADLPGFFQAGRGTTTWLINDGRENLLTAYAGPPQQTAPVWLLDPLGRFLTLRPPGEDEIDLCQEGALPASLETANLAPSQVLRDDMIWDPQTNLYFLEGRTYSPQIGRFLQRDPLGPDVFGNVYTYPFRQAAPPVRQRQPDFIEGLDRLRAALNQFRLTVSRTAGSIREAHMPVMPQGLAAPLFEQLDATAAITQNYLLRQLDFPMWLASSYNQPSAYVDAGGALRLLFTHAPGQGGYRQRGIVSPAFEAAQVFGPGRNWLPQVSSPLSRLEALSQPLAPPERPFVTYEPFGWQPRLPELAGIWMFSLPSLTVEHTPDAVWQWLPQALTRPSDAAVTLDAVLALLTLPERTGQDWMDAALDAALPGLPPLPPYDGSAWLENWFTSDTLGVAVPLSARWPEMPSLGFPVYSLGFHPYWTLPQGYVFSRSQAPAP